MNPDESDRIVWLASSYGVESLSDGDLSKLIRPGGPRIMSNGVTVELAPLRDAARFEMNRRQGELTAATARNLVRATWGLAAVTLLLVIVEIVSIWWR